MSARHLVIGLDGADLELVFSFGREHLPSLFALMDRGVYAHQQSVLPPATLPNWTTFLTALDPGRHGVFDFTLRDGYSVRFTAGTVREAPTWLARLDKLGLRCACVGFPATFPPERLTNGIVVSGWDAPVAFEADRSFVLPASLYDLLTRRFGPLSFDEVDQFRADELGWHERLPGRLCDKVERRAELASFLLAMRSWDVFAFYFGESDTASHYLWSLYDEGSPRRPKDVSRGASSGLLRVYRALDAAVGRLVSQAGPDAEVTIVSDHGSGGSSDKVLYLNRALAEAGLCALTPPAPSASALSSLKRVALHRFPPRLRDRVFRFGGALLPGLLESRTRFAGIDMRRTTAFSDELNYFPAVHFNMRGREPHGTVSEHERAAVTRRVSDALLALRDPWTKRPVVSRVYPREELFEGPYVSRAPDLLLELKLDRGYSYNLMPSGSARSPDAVFERLAPVDFLGKKGRSLPGSHRPKGLFIAAGPSLIAQGKRELSISDASAITLARIGAGLPEHASGLVPDGLLRERGAQADLPAVGAHSSRAPDPSALARRMRALGYID